MLSRIPTFFCFRSTYNNSSINFFRTVTKRFVETQENKQETPHPEPEKNLEKLLSTIQKSEDTIKALNLELRISQNLRLEGINEIKVIRHRAEKEILESKTFGSFSFAKDVIEVADTLEQVLKNCDLKDKSKEEYAEYNELLVGLILANKILHKVFEKNGVKKISPNLGSAFDLKFHLAKFEIPQSATKYPPKSIADVFRCGYSFHDRIIRPAEVGVVKYET